MTVREVAQCCVSPISITYAEDPHNGEIAIYVPITVDAEDILSEWILDHEINLMMVKNDSLIVALYTANDYREG